MICLSQSRLFSLISVSIYSQGIFLEAKKLRLQNWLSMMRLAITELVVKQVFCRSECQAYLHKP